MNAMIFAAGMGTRLMPLTKNKPKALIEVQGVTLIERAIKKLVSSGFDRIIINVHHHANQLIDFLNNNNFDADINISDESDKLLDTGGGLKKAERFFDKNEALLVYNVDVISDIDLRKIYNFHNSSGAIATLAVRNRKTSRYLLFDKKNDLFGWENIKTGEEKIIRKVEGEFSRLAFSGIHIISPGIFNLINKTGKFSMIDVYLELARTQTIKSFNHDNSFWMDIGSIKNLEIINNTKDIF
ncbi:MAG: nucleotidyltransferase family protein [Bacteroidales bacterium]|nr:nucleotidyltransferase family protein [Bacteroidales bacterium]